MEVDHEHTESSSSSGPMEFPSSNPKKSSRKLEVYTGVLRRLMDSGACLDDPSFHDELWHHFNRLPARYAMDVNVERADHVLVHKDLLQEAGKSKRPAWHVGLVQGPIINPTVIQNPEKQESSHKICSHPLPMFGSSANLQLLARDDHEDGVSNKTACRNMYEITFAADDRRKLLNQLTLFLGEIDLNIHEAHAFSTNDGYSLDVFLVEGNQYKGIEELKEALQFVIQKIEKQSQPELPPLHLVVEQAQNHDESQPDHVQIPTDGTDVWEIDLRKLIVGGKIASGSYGDLYNGMYCGQDVAIKVLNPERMNTDMEREFAQEVFIMRKVRHKNLVQFIGASTRPAHLCIVTEFMSGGSVYDFLHKRGGSFKLPALLRAAIDISKGMNYLHQNNIIHRDLKAANLLMDENQVIKVGDFGVARVKDQSGVMTAETGTYRWMAPEVIEHKPYDQKADVFSFGVVLWELLTREIPYEQYTPLQAAVGVVQQGLRPTVPKSTNPKLAQLLEACWQRNPKKRPDFSEIIVRLEKIAEEVKDMPDGHKEKSTGGFLSSFRLGHH